MVAVEVEKEVEVESIGEDDEPLDEDPLYDEPLDDEPLGEESISRSLIQACFHNE